MGISSVISVLSLIGFLGFLAGIGLVVVSASQGRPVRGGVLLTIVGLIAGVLFSVVSQGILVVQPQEVAVVFNTLSGSLDTPRRAGTHIVIPVLQQATIYPIDQQEYTMSGSQEERVGGDDAVRARTSDGQEILLDITVIYAIDPGSANTVHERWRLRYEDDFIRPTARGISREVASRYRAVDIYGEARGELEEGIQETIGARMAEEGLALNDLLIRDITFSEEFAQSIERAQIAQQDAEQARLRVQQREQEADQLRAEAAGQRDAAIEIARGDAQATILQAQAEAEALRLVSEQIAANPSLIQYQYIQTLSDNVQLALVPSNSPFLFDFESLAQPNPDFNAPEVPASQELVIPTFEPLGGTPVATPAAGN
ncbi:MAG: hypothetical protein GYB67_02450 [Chloroflexi bacterium]|nr:hypothetical protein [Chloroflexota bacterium]